MIPLLFYSSTLSIDDYKCPLTWKVLQREPVGWICPLVCCQWQKKWIQRNPLYILQVQMWEAVFLVKMDKSWSLRCQNRTPSSSLVTTEVGLDSWDSRGDDVTMNNGIRVSDTQSSPQHILWSGSRRLKQFYETKDWNITHWVWQDQKKKTWTVTLSKILPVLVVYSCDN